MKCSFRSLSVFILLSLLISAVGVTPVYAASSMEIVPLTLPAGWRSGHLSGVWGSSASDVYAVGYGNNGSATVPLLYYNNGSSWSEFGLSLPAGWGSGYLYGVWGSGPNDVYAVGSGYSGAAFLPLLYHNNGSTWTATSLPLPAGVTSGYLYGIWGSSTNDVYAVGYGNTGTTTIPLLYHSNGSSWSEAGLPAPSGWNSVNFRGIWGSGTSDVHVAGYGSNGSNLLPLLYHKDSSNWAASTLSLEGGWRSGYLYGVWGSSASDVYTVGYGNNGSTTVPLLYHNSGSNWAASSLALPTGWERGYLYGVWGSAANDVYAVGSGNNGSGLRPLLYYNDGSGWSEASPSLPTGWSFGYLQGVWGSDADNIYVVGTANNGSANLPLIYRSSQGGQDLVAPGDVADFTATSGTARGSVLLSWTAPADDYNNPNSGPVSSYLVKYSVSPFASWDDGIPVSTGIPAPGTPGTTQTMTISGLSPGTRYYFAIRAQDEQYNLSNNYPVVMATAKSTPVGVGLYDDNHTAWNYIGSWATYAGSGPYANTLHYTNSQNASASITFTGTQFTVFFARNSNRGNVEVWIDGELEYTFSQNGSSLAWQQSWTLPTPLSNDTHIVQFKNPNAGTSTFIDIDAIQIIGPVQPGTYDDADAAWTYTGSWATYAGSGPYARTMHYTNAQNAAASITFTGTQFTIFFAKHSNRGNVEVWIDGELEYAFSQNGSSLAWQQSWTLPTPLVNGTHTVEFRNPNASTSTYIDIDVIQIVGPVGPGTYDDAHPAWTYTGSWATYAGSGPYASTMHYTNSQNASARITFTGTQFTVFFTKDPNRGNVEVWLDGELAYTFSQNGSPLAWQQNWTLPAPVENVTHTVEFRNPNATTSTFIDIDAIQIIGLAEPVGPGMYDNVDAAWTYTGSWATYTGSGPFANTMHFTSTQGATASITFTGTQFTVFFTRYPNRGDVEVWIDGELAYTFSQNGSPLAWQQMWTLPVALSNETHTVQFKNPNAGASPYIDIDAIQIVGPVEPVGPGMYDDAHPAWSYTGSWAAYTGNGPYANTMHYTNTQGAIASITFTGTQFTVFFARYPNRGDVEVWIDGELAQTFSQNGGSLDWQQSWTLPSSLSNDTHVVQFKNSNAGSSTYIDIDAIQVVAPVGPGTYDDAHPAWTYTGSWATYAGSGPYANTLHYTNAQNAAASITFTGTQFTVFFTQDPNRGDVEVWIDGELAYTFSQNGGSLAWQQTWTLPAPLSNNTHTLQFKNPNASTSTYIDLDTIVIE